ncbi:MAG: carbohydrate ABC transporter permease [Oscillospiraceae bacterium]
MSKRIRKINDLPAIPNLIINIIIILFSLACILPFIFTIIISLTDESVLVNGYSFWPSKWSLEGYKYVFKSGGLISQSMWVSLKLVVIGTVLGLAITSMYAYILFRKDYRFRKFFNWLSFITMIFSAGLVPTYVIMVQVFGLKNSIWSLVFPLLCTPFNIIILKTFYTTSIPDVLIESASIDGSSEFRTFLQIVLPISLPGLATIALFYTLGYWNDWYNALLYIDESKMVPLQYLLMKIQNNINYLMTNSGDVGNAEAMRNMPSESARMVLAVTIILPIACAYPFFQKYFVSGLTVGAVKG